MNYDDIMEAVKFSNFSQAFKTLVWERLEGGFLPEAKLDEIAKEIWDKYVDKKSGD